MKKITLFYLKDCPYCKQTMRDLKALKKENPAYENLEITMIEESEEPDLANSYDYYYVPTFYVDEKKMAEGILDKATVKAVLDAAL